MKVCPKCKRTFDETWKICLHDNAVLEDLKSQDVQFIDKDEPKNDIRNGLIASGVSFVFFGLVAFLFIHTAFTAGGGYGQGPMIAVFIGGICGLIALASGVGVAIYSVSMFLKHRKK